ncbi:peptide chain release factor 2 [Schlesneria sp. T3-172]|uniref:peptide chain release factor 2 n=1 Tax=Schlesneria sphaerica TaxID=3373610 RepID=UPI0037CB15DF
MDNDLKDDCQNLIERILHLRGSLDCDSKNRRIAEINDAMGQPGFWDNQDKAQAQVNELKTLNGVLKPINELFSGSEDLAVLLEFAEADESPETIAEIQQTVDRLKQQFDEVELQAMLSAPEDGNSAYVAIQAGEGGTDAQDFAEMLMRMYQRWAERRGFDAEILDTSPAEEAGIHSATILIRGSYVFGLLKGETGIHRLIRMSPFDSAHRRQTSFAAVDVTPELDDNISIEIEWDDPKTIREDICRASGAGGQKVNKTDSAIRLTHLPSNTVVQCQNERSQHQNRALARKMMIAKLYQIEMDKREAENAARRGEKSRIGFGGETIRSYVLHPESYCKDNRSEYKTSHPQATLDGDLDPWIEAYMRWCLTMKEGK